MAEQVAKLKKKQWFPIIAPKQFNNVVIGETLVYEPSQMLGKTLSHSLMNLTNDTKRQNTSVHFRITDIENNAAKTKIIGYQIIPSSVKRLMRRNSKKMDMSFVCETEDNVLLRIKPVVVTKSKVKGSTGAKVRNNAVSFLSRAIKKMKFDDVMGDLISHKLQSEMRAFLNKIYPLKVCEIRYAGIEARERPQEVKEAQAEAAQQEPEVKI